MNDKILEVTERLARKAMSLGNTYTSSRFSVSGKSVDITMGNGLISAKISFPRQLIDETLDYVTMGYEVEAVMNKFMPPSNIDIVEEEEPEEEEEIAEEVTEEVEKDVLDKAITKSKIKALKKRG